MVRKHDEAAAAPGDHVPRLPTVLDPKVLSEACLPIDLSAYDDALAGSPYRFGDYEVGERVDHLDGITVEEAEHMTATRLYQNTARIHFNQYIEGKGRFGRRLIYGGHVISLARSLSFNGFANAFHIAAINGGRHVAPLFAGGTIFAWSEVLAKSELPGRDQAQGTVYWLLMTAASAAGQAGASAPFFGWKTTARTTGVTMRLRHLDGNGNAVGDWKELTDPKSVGTAAPRTWISPSC